jgi:predicted RNA binding protein YcfA (HicA-like mRNA interferase family)
VVEQAPSLCLTHNKVAIISLLIYHVDVNGKQIIKKLKQHGFKILRSSGSHHILSSGERRVIVPVHGAVDVKEGTVSSIEKQAGVKLK